MVVIEILKTIIQKKKKKSIKSDIKFNKNSSHIVTELFLKWQKRNISLAFIWQSYFTALPQTVPRNATSYFIMKIPRKGENQEIVPNHSSYIDFKEDFMKL